MYYCSYFSSLFFQNGGGGRREVERGYVRSHVNTFLSDAIHIRLNIQLRARIQLEY